MTFKDGSTKEMGVAEFRELPKEQLSNRDAVRIVSGDDLKEFDEYIAVSYTHLTLPTTSNV